MTARRKLRDHMRQLSEIRDIMDAMKNLAFLETHKLGNLLENQQVLIGDLERIAGEFLKFFPYPALSEKQTDSDSHAHHQADPYLAPSEASAEISTTYCWIAWKPSSRKPRARTCWSR